MIRTAARLVVDLREARTELEYRRAGAGGRIHRDARDAIRPRSQEQVPPLAAYVGDREHRVPRQLLLDRCGVGEDLLWNLITIPIGARLETEVGIVDVVSAQDLRRIHRPDDVVGERARGPI